MTDEESGPQRLHKAIRAALEVAGQAGKLQASNQKALEATLATLDERLGSLEPGKDADLVVVSGNPIDPRSHVELVFVEGACIYDAEANGRRW